MKEQEKAERLLKDIRDVFTRTRAKQMSTVELIDELQHVDDFDWSTLQPHRVSKLLKPFDVHPGSIRVKPNERQPKGVAQGYKFESLKDAFERCLPQLPLQLHYKAAGE